MNTAETLDALNATLVEGGIQRVYLLGQEVDVPADGCCVLGPPRLEWNHPGEFPSDASYAVVCVARRDDRMVMTLLSLVAQVGDALAKSPHDWSLSGAEPGTFPDGAVSLPAYIIEIEAALT